MHPTLARIEQDLRAGAAGLTLEQLSAGPPGKWTTAEIIEHLGRTYSGTAAGMHRALAADRPLATRPTLGRRAAVLLVVEFGYLPSGRKSPKVAEPIGADPAIVLEQALAHLHGMDDALARAEARFGARVNVLDHPILGALSVRRWRRLHWVHARHHLRQIATRFGR